jgi:hypothetical protein
MRPLNLSLAGDSIQPCTQLAVPKTAADLQLHDGLFERRVANLKWLLSSWGISARVGDTIKRSESRPSPVFCKFSDLAPHC